MSLTIRFDPARSYDSETVVAAPPEIPGSLLRLRVPPSSDESRLRTVIESAPIGLMLLRASGQIAAANRAALALLDVDHFDRIRGGSIEAFIASEDRERIGAFIQGVCEGEPASVEYRVVNRAGESRTVEMRAVPVRLEGAGSSAFLGVVQESRARSEDAADRAERDRLDADREAAEQALAAANDFIVECRKVDAALRARIAELETYCSELLDNQSRLRAAVQRIGRSLHAAGESVDDLLAAPEWMDEEPEGTSPADVDAMEVAEIASASGF